jgi:aromatic-L-amino-acid decarboxylase
LNTPAPPFMDERYAITAPDEEVSIDSLVQFILSRSSESPVMQGTKGASLASELPFDPPRQGTTLSNAVDELMATAGSHYRKNAHPGMFAFVASPGLPTDPLGHALTASLNQNVTGFQSAPGATVVENTLVRWMCRLAGLPANSGGLILAGGSWANLTAMSVAIHHGLGPRARQVGIHGGPQPIVLAADTAHFSIERAANVLGLGKAGIETLPLGDDFRLDPEALRAKLRQFSNDADRKVCCVVASAGTTTTGAIDPLGEIAGICRENGVWLHVDAAYGGAALLSDDLRHTLDGIGESDSITIDLHKWCYLAFDGSLLLYRNPEFARDLFQFDVNYASSQRDQHQETPTFLDLSPEVSRRGRALPAYLAWRHYGIERLGRNIQHNADCARYLASLANHYPDMETVAEPQLSICCFRYKPASLKGQDEKVDALNKKILQRLNQSGEFILSSTKINDRPVVRVCICSHRTRPHHMLSLVESVRRIGEELVAE